MWKRPSDFPILKGLVEHVWPMIADGRFKPLISHVFPLAEADKAHAQMEASDHAGKVILRVA